MNIKQFIKTLNNTEIGRGGTHECYVLVSKKVLNIQSFFDDSNRQPIFNNLKNGGKIESIHITDGREFRINGLGDFYRSNNVNAGDEIFFERRDNLNMTEFFINLNTKNNVIIFQKNSNGLEALNIDRLTNRLSNNSYTTEVIYQNNLGILNIVFKESLKKRADSPAKTDFYSVTFDNRDLSNDLNNNEYFELIETNQVKKLKKAIVWQSYEFNI